MCVSYSSRPTSGDSGAELDGDSFVALRGLAGGVSGAAGIALSRDDVSSIALRGSNFVYGEVCFRQQRNDGGAQHFKRLGQSSK